MARTEIINLNVRMRGVAELRRALSKYAPEVKKELDKANREAGKPLLALAQNNVPSDAPLSGWGKTDGNGMWNDRQGRGWDSGQVKKGLKIRMGKRSRRSPWSAVTQLRNDNAAGSIFELAGTKTKSSVFVDNLNAKYPLGSVTRVIWKAVKEYPIAKYRMAVLDNYKNAEKKLQQILDGIPNS